MAIAGGRVRNGRHSRKRAAAADAIWIDARPQEEFEREHVPGALLLNEDRWNELLPQVLAIWAPEKRVVVYCSSESCGSSREIAHRLRKEAGLTNVFVLEGGWEAWKRRSSDRNVERRASNATPAAATRHVADVQRRTD